MEVAIISFEVTCRSFQVTQVIQLRQEDAKRLFNPDSFLFFWINHVNPDRIGILQQFIAIFHLLLREAAILQDEQVDHGELLRNVR